MTFAAPQFLIILLWHTVSNADACCGVSRAGVFAGGWVVGLVVLAAVVGGFAVVGIAIGVAEEEAVDDDAQNVAVHAAESVA